MNDTLKALLSGQEENHILPFLWQHGEDEETLRHYMRVIHDANIGAVCVESRPHPDFCGPKWWADMDAIIDEAKKLSMKVWILDDSHFPTGFANGALKEADPSLCRQSLVCQTVDVPEGGEAVLKLSDYQNAAPFTPSYIEGVMLQMGSANKPRIFDDDILLGIVAVKKGGSADDGLLTVWSPKNPEAADADGQVRFAAPDGGNWQLAILHLTRNRGPHRDYMNMMDPDSCRKLIEAVYEPHYAHYGKEFGTTIAGFFSDEPEIGNGHLYEFDKKIGEMDDQAWSSPVGKQLQEKWGSDYLRFLPLIWNRDFDSDIQARVRVDYMDAVTREVEEDFSRQTGDWCRAHGVKYIGHLIEDSHQHTRTASSLGHYFRGLAGQDWAGVDDIGGQVLPQGEGIGPGDFLHPVRDGEFWHYILGKLCSSMAAIDPLKKGDGMCEIFGNYGWSEGVRLEKYLADHLMVRGINNYVPHAFSPKAFPDPDCPPHFYAHGHNPQFRHFGALMKYMNRVCTLISGGKPVIPAAILYNAEADWAGDFMYLQKPAIPLYDSQIDYLIVPADVFTDGQYRTVIGKELKVGEQSFKAFIIPWMEYIPEAAAKAALELAEKGCTVVFIDALPKATVEGGTSAPEIAALKESGAFVCGVDELVSVLRTRGICDAGCTPESSRLRIYHYEKDPSLAFYMVVNESDKPYTGKIILPGKHRIALYDAWENRVLAARQTTLTDAAEVQISLDPSKSIFLLLDADTACEDGSDPSEELAKNSKPAASESPETPAKPDDLSSCAAAVETVSLDTGWQRSFCRALDYPAFPAAKEISLPDTLAEEEPKFSGIVRYEKTLAFEELLEKTELVITDAYEGVEVFVNGKSLGIQVVPQFVYDLTADLRPGANSLVIEVATTLERESVDFPNRFKAMGMQMPPVTVPSGINGKVYLKTTRI